MPPQVLERFHSRFPNARLEDRNRGRASRFAPLDLNLLRSPQLHTLDILLHQTAIRVDGEERNVSEFPALKRMLQQNPNLRVLRLAYSKNNLYQLGAQSQNWQSEYNIDGQGHLNLQFEQGDTFPTLTELVIIGNKREQLEWQYNYDMSERHCIAWKRVMNWSSLTKLDLGASNSYNFFTVFCGSVPQLKSLKFRLIQRPEPALAVTERFLDSIHALEELAIEDDTKEFFVPLCTSIRKHGESLRRLMLIHLCFRAMTLLG
jgi:hypothetical protein